MAVTAWVPGDRMASGADTADPPARLTGDPTSTPSTANCTCPVGVSAPGATGPTVAVNVTGCPKTEGVCEEATATVVSALATVWPPGNAPALWAKLTEPPYVAVTAWGPTRRSLTATEAALPPESATGPPMLLPSMPN